jgi:hypothetical protein
MLESRHESPQTICATEPREKDPLDRVLFRRILQAVRRVAAIRDAVALAPSPRRSNRWRARGSVQIVCAFVGKTASQVN